MKTKRQIATLAYRGQWKIIHNEGKRYNPFEIYYTYYDKNSKHTRKVTEYADMQSAMWVLYAVVKNNLDYETAKEMYGFTAPKKCRQAEHQAI